MANPNRKSGELLGVWKPLANRFLSTRSTLVLILLTLTASSGQTAGSHNDRQPPVSYGDTGGKKLSVLLASGVYPAHVFPLVALGQELLSRGHRVALMSLEYQGSKVIPDLPKSAGIEFISAGNAHWSVEDYEGVTKKAKGKGFINMLRAAMNGSCEGARNFFKAVESLSLDEWDFFVMDNVVMMEFFHIFKKLGHRKMMMKLSPLPATPVFQPTWPFPVFMSPYSDRMGYFERLVTAVLYKPIEIIGMLFAGYAFTMARTCDIDYDIDVGDLFNSMGMHYPVLLNTVIGFEFAKPSYPMQHYVGPMLMKTPPPIQPSLLQWLDSRETQSVVYITMGTSASLTAQLGSTLLNGILSTNYSAVWVLRQSNRDILEGLHWDAERIHLVDWVSQLSLLSHTSIGATLNHGGLGCVQEALNYGLPVVVIPFAFDQYDVASRVHYQGLGIRIFENDITEQAVSEAISTVMTGSHRERARRVSKMFGMAGGARRAADLVEHYADVGYEHAVPAFVKYRWSWVQFYNVDVYITIATVGSLLVYLAQKVLRKCLRRLCSCCCSKEKHKSE